MCGRFWGTYKLFNLCLKSQWQHADTKDFLADLEEYVLKVVCRENTTQQMEDKIASLCNFVKRYKDWIVICHQRSIRKDCGDVKKWRNLLNFLMQPLTYLLVHILVDIFEIITVHSKIAQDAEAVDLYEQVGVVIAQIKGYIQLLPVPNESKSHRKQRVVCRALKGKQLSSNHWHIEKCLSCIGYTVPTQMNRLDLWIKNYNFRMEFTQDSFTKAYTWLQKFCTNYVSSLERCTKEANCWKALSELTQPTTWTLDNSPMTSLTIMAKQNGVDVSVIEGEWGEIKKVVQERLGIIEMNDKEFRMEILLPSLTDVRDNWLLKRCLVVGIIAFGHRAHFENGGKIVEEIWRKRHHVHHESENLCKQARFALNNVDRISTGVLSPSLENQITAIENLWVEDMHIHNERIDKGKPRLKRSLQSFANHLTECLDVHLPSELPSDMEADSDEVIDDILAGCD